MRRPRAGPITAEESALRQLKREQWLAAHNNQRLPLSDIVALPKLPDWQSVQELAEQVGLRVRLGRVG